MRLVRTWLAIAAFCLAASSTALAAADQKQLDINSATVEQFNSLQGIGDSKARAIVAYRDEHGPFRSVEDLKDVKGIGDKLLDSLRPQITVSSAQTAPAANPKVSR